MNDSLFDLYYNMNFVKELWGKLEIKYMKEDATSKKFLVSNFNNFKMVDERPVIKQFCELERILNHFSQHNLYMNEIVIVSSIIDKLPPS